MTAGAVASGVTVIGWLGVTMFFALSGYVVTLSLQRGTTLRAFYGRRIRRLAPAFVPLLAVVVMTNPLHVWELGFLGSMTYSANWLIAAGVNLGPLDHVWSLSVEEQFYFLWPILLLFAPRFVGPVSVAVMLVGLLTYLALPSWPAVVFTTPACAVALLAGSRLALAGRGSGRLRRLAPLAPIGRRAYSLYLWNWPLTLALGPLLGTAASIGAAELSYRFLERGCYVRTSRYATIGAMYSAPGAPVPFTVNWISVLPDRTAPMAVVL